MQVLPSFFLFPQTNDNKNHDIKWMSLKYTWILLFSYSLLADFFLQLFFLFIYGEIFKKAAIVYWRRHFLPTCYQHDYILEQILWTERYIEDIQIFCWIWHLFHRVKWKIFIFHEWRSHEWNIHIFHFTSEIKDIFNRNIWIFFLLYTTNQREENFNNHKLIFYSVPWQRTSELARVKPNKWFQFI